MSEDKVTRADLLQAIEDSTMGAAITVTYRDTRVSFRLTSFSGWARISVGFRSIEFDRRNEELTDWLRALRDLDYLIDILSGVNEAALKGDN